MTNIKNVKELKLENTDFLIVWNMLQKANKRRVATIGDENDDGELFIANENLLGEIIVHEFDSTGHFIDIFVTDTCKNLEEWKQLFE